MSVARDAVQARRGVQYYRACMNAVTKSQAILLSAHAVRLVLSVAVAVLLARSLSVADFGFVALVSVLYVVAVEFLDMGTTAAATRAIAARPARERETLTTLLALRRLLSLGAAAAVLALVASGYVVRDDQRLVLAAAAGGLFLMHLHAYQVAFQVRQDYRPATALALAGQLGFLAACVAALKLHAGGAVIGLLVVAREAVLALGSRFLGIRRLGERLHAPWRDAGLGALWQAAWMIGIAGMGYKLSTHAGSFLLWKLASPEALASFNAAQRLLLPMADMAWLFATPLIAALSATVARNPCALRVQLEGHLKLLLCLSALVAVAGYFLAPFVLRLLYGEPYATGPWSSVGPFRWLALGYLCALATPVLIVGEMVRGHARALLYIGLGCLALNLAANAWAIPAHGAQGAAMVLSGCEALVFLALLARCTARGDLRPNPRWVAYLAPAAALGAALWLLEGWPLWQLALAGAWAPASLLLVMQLPAQRACRASLSMTAAP
jgi:O-antigen/teichoic acid export membrane protein